jgi:hypothetical protein
MRCASRGRRRTTRASRCSHGSRCLLQTGWLSEGLRRTLKQHATSPGVCAAPGTAR